MARFPQIQSACPYKSQFATMMDGEMCRLCQRQVFDLTHMTDCERVAFLQGCGEEICVSYRFPLRPALAAAALAVSMASLPAAAQEPVPPAAEEPAIESDPDYSDMCIGAIRDPRNADYVDDTDPSAVPELPVAYEDAPARPAPE